MKTGDHSGLGKVTERFRYHNIIKRCTGYVKRDYRPDKRMVTATYSYMNYKLNRGVLITLPQTNYKVTTMGNLGRKTNLLFTTSKRGGWFCHN